MTTTDNTREGGVTLLPCPFCGAMCRAFMQFSATPYPWAIDVSHQGNCAIGMFDGFCYETEAEAITAWNTRTASPDKRDDEAIGEQTFPSLELCVQFSDNGRHIRKWSRLPFDGGTCLYSHPASSPRAPDEGLLRESLASELCDARDPRRIAEQADAPDYFDSAPHVRDYWLAIADAAIAVLCPAIPRNAGGGK